MAASLADLEKLFKELVMGATPEATSVRRYWDGDNLSIDVVIPLDGEFSQHIIKISILEEAINTYARHNNISADTCVRPSISMHRGSPFGGCLAAALHA